MSDRQQADRVLAALRLLADETRWQLLTKLRQSDYQVSELVDALHLPQNLVSYHLGLLRQAGFVRVHRSEADARSIYYSLDLAVISATHASIGAELSLVPPSDPYITSNHLVVFLCTGNSARSQMAEGWLRQRSGGRVPVRSAGTHPRTLHPLAVAAMAEVGVDIGYQQSKDISTLVDYQPTVLVTVCDRAREECAPLLKAALVLHWSIADPAETSDIKVFRMVRDELRSRVDGLLALFPAMPIAEPVL
jgi:ArsR family transcriptional regulator